MRIERMIAGTLALLLVTAVPAASAHPFATHGAGFAAGLTHPFLGLDHLLAMLGVGIWATQIARRQQRMHAVWIAPLAFVVVMTLTAMAAIAGLALPAVEAGLAASVLVLGLLITVGLGLSLRAGAFLVALFAAFHGHAHGVEMPYGAAMVGYGAGFALATAALHALGVAGALLLASRATLLRWLGAGMAAAGAVFLTGL